MHRARAFAPSNAHYAIKELIWGRFRGGGWLLLHPKINRCTQQLRFQAASMGAGSSMDIIRSPSMHRARAFAPSGGHGVDKVLFGDRFRGGVWLLLHPKIDRCTQQLRFQAASMGAGSSMDIIRSPSMHRARKVMGLKKRESERNTKLLMVGNCGNYDWPIAFVGYVLHVLSQSDFPQLPKRKKSGITSVVFHINGR